jgi:hypothetical protein
VPTWELPVHRLLILSCSQRKRPNPELLPAIERYDGPAFRVLRRFLREKPSERVDVSILSAKFGLVPHDLPIPDYDMRMTPARARSLRQHVSSEFAHLVDARSYKDVFVLAGRDYLEAFDPGAFSIARPVNIKASRGSLGEKLTELHIWLHGRPPPSEGVTQSRNRRRPPRIRGREVALTPEQVLAVARQALPRDPQGASNYKTWYVLVDDHRVAPKWLVNQLTGLSVSEFQAREARHFLQRIGIEVGRA